MKSSGPLLNLCVLALVVAASIALRPAPAKALTELTLGYGSADAIYGPWFYAQENGYFTRHGLKTTLSFLDSGAKGVQALIGGAVDIEAADGLSVVAAKRSGADIIFIGMTLGTLTGDVYMAKTISSPADLKGKRWGIGSFGSESQMAAAVSLRHFGMSKSDVVLVQVGNQGNRFATLDSGQIRVTTFLPPVSSKAEAAGYRSALSLPQLVPECFSVGPTITAAFLKAHRAEAKAFLEALEEASAAYRKDKAGGMAAIERFLRAKPEDAALAWEYFAPLKPAGRRPTATSFALPLELLKDPAGVTAPISDFFDASLLDELEAEGFFKKL